MTKVLSSENIVNITTDTWGECSLSCLDPNVNNNPLITNYKFTAEVMNKLEIGTGNQGTNSMISSLKGKISDFYLWDFPITSEMIHDFVFCENKNSTYDEAKISWQYLKKQWKLNLDGKSLLIYEKERHQLCQRQEFRRFYGFQGPGFGNELRLLLPRCCRQRNLYSTPAGCYSIDFTSFP